MGCDSGGIQGMGVRQYGSVGIMGHGGVGVCYVWTVMRACEFTRK